MKRILFLDIDGVLNHDRTKIYTTQGFHGLEPRLVNLYLDWKKLHEDLYVVLSSTWRTDPFTRNYLVENGVKFDDVTPILGTGFRGHEIDAYFRTTDTVSTRDNYGILDDTQDFHGHQKRFLVLTSPVHGLQQKNLVKLERILYG